MESGQRPWVDTRAARIALYGGLALLYLGLVLLRTPERFQGDEWRYVYYANNLVNGYFSPPEITFLWNGPGYPLLLAPIAWAGLPWMAARLLNAAFMLGAVGYFHASARMFASERAALGAALAFGLYPPLLVPLHAIYTETLTVLLLLSFAWHCLRAFREGSALHTVASGLFLGAAALTKVVFGPALLLWALLALLGALVRSARMLRALAIAGLAFVLCLPWLAYTHSVTGRTFYWGSASGMSMYFLSSPYPGESGDWYHQRQIRRIPALRRNHLATIERIGRFREVPEGSALGELHFLSTDESDAEFKRIAVDNLKKHPLKVASNWAANVSRLLFDTPFSYKIWPRQPIVYAINAPLLALALWAALLALRRRDRLELGAALVLLLVLIALGANSIVSAVGRYSAPLLPLVGLWAITVLRPGLPAPAR